MCYGLIPRFSGTTGEIFWDDPAGPHYSIVKMTPLSHYEMPRYSLAQVEVRRDYLEDFLSLKGCAAVAVFYEERYSQADPVFASLLQGEKHTEFIDPGRRLVLQVVHDWGSGTDYSEVWGCALLLKPESRPITDDSSPGLLDWPEHPAYKPSGLFDNSYISDGVLTKYEADASYDIEPRSGSVSHGSWWSASHCTRFGRNHIRVDLRKLYEGAPSDVIRHYHSFAVSQDQAEADLRRYGERHIGIRAHELIEAYLTLIDRLDRLLSDCNVHQAVSQVSPKSAHHTGWWRMAEFRQVAAVVPVTLPRDTYLARCKILYSILELLREGALRKGVVSLGVKEEAVSQFRSLKLLAILCQLKQTARERGIELLRYSSDIAKDLDITGAFPLLDPLFALNELRQLDSHPAGRDFDQRLQGALAKFGLSINKVGNEWGIALDETYDRMAISLLAVAGILR